MSQLDLDKKYFGKSLFWWKCTAKEIAVCLMFAIGITLATQ